MKRIDRPIFWLWMLIIIASISPATAPGEDSIPPLTVTYIANDGFMFECRNQKVVIDAFFGGRDIGPYATPSDSLVALIRTAQPPFDNIDLIAVTHYHEDHFAADIVAAHMKSNPRSFLICPPQVDERLQKIDGYPQLKHRIYSLSAPIDSVLSLDLGEIDVCAISGKHGSYIETDEKTGEKIDLHRHVQHLEYLITLCGRTIFHSGDAPLNDMTRYPRLGLDRADIELALVQRFTPRKQMSFNEKLIWETIRPKKIIMMHLPPGGAYSEPEYESICTERGIIVPHRSLQSWTVE